MLTNFIRLDAEQSILVANIFLEKLEEFVEFFGSQRRYHLYASSLLFVYDFASLQAGKIEELKSSVRLKLIDFAHVFPANGVGDDNFIFGLKNLSDLFRKFIVDQTTWDLAGSTKCDIYMYLYMLSVFLSKQKLKAKYVAKEIIYAFFWHL